VAEKPVPAAPVLLAVQLQLVLEPGLSLSQYWPARKAWQLAFV